MRPRLGGRSGNFGSVRGSGWTSACASSLTAQLGRRELATEVERSEQADKGQPYVAPPFLSVLETLKLALSLAAFTVPPQQLVFSPRCKRRKEHPRDK